jgi:hypothetical protein
MDLERVRVSDAQCEAVVARLSAATGEGRLTLEEFGDRAALAYAARTEADLARLVEDLPAVPPPPSPEPVVQHNPIGTVMRGGRWRLDRDTHISTTFGAVKLDLTQAEIVAPEVWLHVRAAVGAVKVWIPRGVRVEVAGTTFLGSRRVEEETATGFAHAPVLHLRIDTGVGSVKVYR